MKIMRILKGFFIAVGVIVTILVAGGIVFAVKERQPPKEPHNVILTLDFSKDIKELSEPSPLDAALDEVAPASVLDIVMGLDRARQDPHVKGLMARFDAGDYSMAQAQEIRAALARFSEAGKFTYAFATSYGDFGLSNKDYYLASAFESIWLQPVGTVGLTGLALETPFAKTALDKIGVQADFMQREEYKSFMESGQRDDYSPPVKAMMQALADDLANQLAEGIAQSRSMKAEDVKGLMLQGPYLAVEAEKLKLITHLGYEDELVVEAKKKAGDDAEQVSLEDYRDFDYGAKKDEPKQKAHIALIYGLGVIASGDNERQSLMGDRVMNAQKIAGAFNDAADDKDVDAILFRIDSPGGSPDASETIRHALIRAQGKGKKVVVSMGGVAASGGYWVAMSANHIVADPATLTGSIGVVGGKFTAGELLKKLGVHIGAITTDANAGLWSVSDNFTPAQRARVNAMLDDTYAAFTQGVAEGRHIPLDKMPDIAKGRVWTGSQAIKIGLVDELGGYDVAFAALRQQLGLADDAALDLDEYPRPLTPMERVLKMLKGFGIESAMVRSGAATVQALGKQAAALGLTPAIITPSRVVNAQITIKAP